MTPQLPTARSDEWEGELFRLFVENVKDYAIFVIDPEGRVQSWNPGAEQLLGYREQEVLGQSVEIFFTPEDVQSGVPQREIRQAAEVGRGNDDRWHVRKDGSRFWCGGTMTPLWDGNHTLCGFAKIMRDRTEFVRAEEAMAQRARESEQRRRLYEAALSNTPDLVYVFDLEHRFIYANEGLLRMWGRTWDEAIGKNCLELGYEPWHAAMHDREIDQVVATREPIKGEVPFTGTFGRRIYEYIFVPVLGENGEVEAVAGTTRDVTDRRQGEELVRHSEERFRGLMEQAPFSIQVFSPDGRTTRVNRAWEELWGVTLEQIADYNVLEDPQLEAKGVRSYLQRAFAGEVVAIPAIEYDPNKTIPDLTRHQNPQRWVSAVAYPLKDEAGQVREVILVHEDITASRKSDAALRKSEERGRLALEAGRMGVWEWNIQSNAITWSDNLEPLHGLAHGSFDGTFDGFQKLIHPEDRDIVNRAIQQAITQGTGYDIEFRNIWPNGTIHWIAGKGMVFADSNGQPERLIGVAMDVTHRKRSVQTARFLADASATLAVLVDFDSTLQKVASLAVPNFADWAAVDLVEMDGSLRRVAVAHVDPSKVALAHDVHRRFTPDPEAPQGTWNILRTGKSELVSEITDEMLAGSIKAEELLQIMRELGLRSYMGVPLKVRGKVLGVVTFIAAESGHRYDATDLVIAQDLADRGGIAIENAQLYRELREADRRKDEFLATLAHELRNPLAPIRNSLQILKMPRIDVATAQQARDMMERQVHHLVRLVDDLLDVSRVMRGKIELRREAIEFATVVARAVETASPLIEVQEHQLDVSLPAESLLLDADPVRLAQVIGNLLTNAAKYTESNGHIWLSAAREGGHVVLKVRDNGIGIDADMLPHVFDLFVQVDHTAIHAQGGLGIGLTLVKNLVEMHAGTVAVHSDGLGKGSEFMVRLPLATRDQRKLSEESESPNSAHATGFRLLVVDDNEDAAVSLAMLLRLQGHEVFVANEGLSALELAKSMRPDLVFLDIGMPGMDGYEVARRLRQTPGLEKMILAALTGWGQQEDRRRSAAAGFDHHLVKPPEPKALEGVLAGLKVPISPLSPGNPGERGRG